MTAKVKFPSPSCAAWRANNSMATCSSSGHENGWRTTRSLSKSSSSMTSPEPVLRRSKRRRSRTSSPWVNLSVAVSAGGSLVGEPRSARTATSRFSAHPTSPFAARRFVAETIEKFGCDRHADAAVLMANELITNAVVHAGTPVTVVVQAEGQAVRVEVHDQNPRPPLRRIAFGDDESGRGLGVVESLSTRWGVDPVEGGKSVWFELTG